MKIDFKVTGTMEIPDDVIKHYDVAGKLYALEFNDIMYMLQICIVAEQGAGGFDILHQYEEMENHRITNLRYDDAEFFEKKSQNMTLNELILKLQEHQELCGEYECSISIDTSDAFNVTRLDDVLINRYEATDTPDGYVYEVCLHGEMIPQED